MVERPRLTKVVAELDTICTPFEFLASSQRPAMPIA